MHKESIHEGVTYPCDECGAIFTAASSVRTHKKNIHQQIVFPCDQCDYAGGSLHRLMQHKKSKHEVKSMSCDQCNYVAKSFIGLNKHKRLEHRLQKEVTCDLCSFSGTKNQIKAHKELTHLGLMYACDLCEYSTYNSRNFSKHMRNKHT